jgi:hypothetical protein
MSDILDALKTEKDAGKTAETDPSQKTAEIEFE